MIKKTTNDFSMYYDMGDGFYLSIFNKHFLGTKIVARIGKKKAFIVSIKRNADIDDMGKHDLWEIVYGKQKDKGYFKGLIRIYDEAVIFSIIPYFSINRGENKSPYGHPYISFPSFEGEAFEEECSCFSFKRQVPFNYPVQWKGSVVSSLRQGKHIPLLITNSKYETVILSPYDRLLFGTVSIEHSKKRVRCGIPRSVNIIKKGYCHETILIFGRGVIKSIERFGDILMKKHNTTKTAIDADVSLKYLSYFTNAGSTYWYNVAKGKSYEETIKELVLHHQKAELKIGAYQLDSWWYKKEGADYFSGIKCYSLAKEVKSKNFNSIIPFLQRYKNINLFCHSDLGKVQKMIDKPLILHFKQIAKDSIYVKEKPEDFLVESFAVPKNKKVGKALFNELFNNSSWNLSVVIHDWLQYMNDKHFAFSNMKVANEYFDALDEVLKEIECKANNNGHVSLQLCMTQPHMTLRAVKMQSVTTIRSTCDSDSFFVEGVKRWWWHLYSSTWIQAIGKIAFYDNRKTNSKHIHPYSSNIEFEMIMLALSCGPIAIGDRIRKENIGLIKKCVNDVGEIIKPDKPSVPIDKCFLDDLNSKNAVEGACVYTMSKINDNFIAYYILMFSLHPYGKMVSVMISFKDLYLEDDREYLIFDYKTREIECVDKKSMIYRKVNSKNFKYLILIPNNNDIAYLGNINKHIPLSLQLHEYIEFSKNSIEISLIAVDSMQDACYCFYSKKKILGVYLDDREIAYYNDESKIYVNVSLQFVDKTKAYKLKVEYTK